MMNFSTLGSSSMNVSRIALGGMSFPSVLEGEKIIQTALAGGINFFDTADLYDQGENERIVGKALAAVRQRHASAHRHSRAERRGLLRLPPIAPGADQPRAHRRQAAHARGRGPSRYDAPLSLAPPGHPRVVSAPPAPRQRAVDGVDRQHIRSDVCTMPRGRKLRDEDGDAQHEGHGSYGLSD